MLIKHVSAFINSGIQKKKHLAQRDPSTVTATQLQRLIEPIDAYDPASRIVLKALHESLEEKVKLEKQIDRYYFDDTFLNKLKESIFPVFVKYYHGIGSRIESRRKSFRNEAFMILRKTFLTYFHSPDEETFHDCWKSIEKDVGEGRKIMLERKNPDGTKSVEELVREHIESLPDDKQRYLNTYNEIEFPSSGSDMTKRLENRIRLDLKDCAMSMLDELYESSSDYILETLKLSEDNPPYIQEIKIGRGVTGGGNHVLPFKLEALAMQLLLKAEALTSDHIISILRLYNENTFVTTSNPGILSFEESIAFDSKIRGMHMELKDLRKYGSLSKNKELFQTVADILNFIDHHSQYLGDEVKNKFRTDIDDVFSLKNHYLTQALVPKYRDAYDRMIRYTKMNHLIYREEDKLRRELETEYVRDQFTHYSTWGMVEKTIYLLGYKFSVQEGTIQHERKANTEYGKESGAIKSFKEKFLESLTPSVIERIKQSTDKVGETRIQVENLIPPFIQCIDFGSHANKDEIVNAAKSGHRLFEFLIKGKLDRALWWDIRKQINNSEESGS